MKLSNLVGKLSTSSSRVIVASPRCVRKLALLTESKHRDEISGPRPNKYKTSLRGNMDEYMSQCSRVLFASSHECLIGVHKVRCCCAGPCRSAQNLCGNWFHVVVSINWIRLKS